MNDPLFLKAGELHRQGLLEEALPIWESLVEDIRWQKLPDQDYLYTCLYHLGECYSELDYYEAAIAVFEEAINLGLEIEEENLYIPQSELAWLYNATNQTQKAIELYRKAIEQSNDEYSFFNTIHLGDIQVHINFGESIQYYQNALILAKKNRDAERTFIAIEKLVVSFQGREMYKAAIAIGEEGVNFLENSLPWIIDARLQLASVYESSGWQEKALEQLDKVEVSLTDKIPKDDLLEYQINLLHLRGNAALRTQKIGAAEEYFNEALALIGGDIDTIASFKYDIASSYLSIEKYQEAEKYFKEAIELGEQVDNEFTVISSKGQLAALYYILARYEEAIEIQEVLLIKEKANEDWSSYSATINNLSNAYKQIGHLEKAQKLLDESGEIAKKLAPTDYLIYLGNNAAFYSFWGDNETSLSILEEALKLAVKEDITDQIPRIQQEIGVTYYLLGFYEEALKRLKALENHKVLTEHPSRLLSTYNVLGMTYSELNEEVEAESYFKKAVQIVDEYQIRASLPTIYNNLGVLYLGAKKYDLATPLLLKALEVDKELGQISELSTDYHNVGLLYHDQQKYQQAYLHFQESITLKEQLRSQASSQERMAYLDKEYNTYELLVDSLIRLGKENVAFEILERHKDRELLNKMNASNYKGTAYLASFKKLLPEDTAVLILSNSRTNSLLTYAISNSHHQVNLLSLDGYFSKDFPWTSKIQNKPNQDNWFTQKGRLIQEQLKDFVFQIKKERTASSEKLESLVHYYRQRICRDPRLSTVKKVQLDKAIGAFFYEMIFTSFKQLFKNKKRLIIIPDDLFGLIPFDVFIDGNSQYLTETFEIQYISSIGLLRHALTEKRQPKNNGILAMGIQNYESNNTANKLFSNAKPLNIKHLLQKKDISVASFYNEMEVNAWQNLPFAEQEIEILKNATSRDICIIKGQKVTPIRFQKMADNQELNDYGIFHFAIHAISLPIFPEFSALVLALDSNGGNKYYSLKEIEKLNLENELTFLSACETALGRLYSGDGTVSLTNAFLIAGSQMVISSLWAIHDKHTMLFVKQFYELLETMPVSKAFAQTKKVCIRGDLGKDLQNPVYWGAFVLWGY